MAQCIGADTRKSILELVRMRDQVRCVIEDLKKVLRENREIVGVTTHVKGAAGFPVEDTEIVIRLTNWTFPVKPMRQYERERSKRERERKAAKK